MERKEYDQDVIDALRQIVDSFDKEDQSVRERQIRLWKKLEFLWAGFTRIWWSEVAHDWRVYDPAETDADYESGFYDKSVNVYRAYLETIIAALSSTVPPVKCKPDDADNVSDILTAKGGTKIASLVYDHNDVPLLWVRALWIYCTQGMVAAYNYSIESDKYGTVDVADYKDFEEERDAGKICPNCQTNIIDEEALNLDDLRIDEFDPPATKDSTEVFCSTCQILVQPEIAKEKIVVTRQVGTIKKAKARQRIEVNGGLFVKVPNYARNQEDTPYVAYEYETHFTNVYKKYPHLRQDNKEIDTKVTSSSGNEAYERWGRLSTQYYGEYPLNTPTCRNWWLRPQSFEIIPDKEVREKLYKLFPDGAKCVFVNEIYAEAVPEALDDHWTLAFNPLSNYIHYDPLGLLLVSIQEITSDLISLTLQTIEHGIPQTFADPSVLNFDAYKQQETVPGAIYPARPKSGKTIAEGFHTISTATLSREVEPFSNKIQEMGQFVSGALPSLFGGVQPSSSRTASQYAMSRNQALQRLQTPWKIVNTWWKGIFGKVIPAYIKSMISDERIVKEEYNTYVNIIIRKAELDGKLGDIELESSEELPHTWAQVRDVVTQLMETQNPQILEALTTPENYPILKQAIGLDRFHIPGEVDREKQNEEIQILLRSEPIIDEQGVELPSIMPEFFVDNHKIEGDTCRNWLVSEVGRQTKSENSPGYKNVLLHLRVHIQMYEQISGGMQQQPIEGNTGNQPSMDNTEGMTSPSGATVQ